MLNVATHTPALPDELFVVRGVEVVLGKMKAGSKLARCVALFWELSAPLVVKISPNKASRSAR
jgi:hypothetical protein